MEYLHKCSSCDRCHYHMNGGLEDGSKVLRCWLTDEEDEWVRSYLAKRHRPTWTVRYDQLQAEACQYTTLAAEYQFDVIAANGAPPLEYLWALSDSGQRLLTEDWYVKHALWLRGEGPRIRGKIEEFRCGVLLAISS